MTKKLVLATFLLGSLVGVARAAAPANPPGGNLSEPLNATAASQLKSGSLKVGGTTLPVAKASLEIGEASGATGGLLLPRVTTAQRNAITADGVANAGLKGLEVYNTQLKQIEIFNGLNWKASNATSSLGYGGPGFFEYLATNATGVVGWNEVGAMSGGDYTPLASLQAGEFVSPPGDFNSVTGVYKPSVPGRYVLEFASHLPYGVAICKNVSIPTGGPIPAGCAVGWATTNSAKVTTLFDADGVNDSFKVFVYLSSGQLLYGGNTHYTHFSAARVGNSFTIVPQDNSTTIEPPVGMVSFFQLTSCPAKWTLMDGNNGTINMQGMYAVGSTGSSVGLTPTGSFTRLGNLENRVTGAHTHGIPSLTVTGVTPARTYTGVANYYAGGLTARCCGNAWPGVADGATFANNAQTSSVGYVYGATTKGSFYSTGSAGTGGYTNAPYVQLLPCQKTSL